MQEISMDFVTAALTGPKVESLGRSLRQVRAIFQDQQAAAQMPDDLEIYSVQIYSPVSDHTEGGLQWGNTVVQPGRVGDEFFMTKGHFHQIRNRGEFYVTVQGNGALILMDEAGTTWSEPMSPATVHYIPGSTAHRVANTGDTPLIFAACWPSDAGHDYGTIERDGFGARMMLRDGSPVLVPRS